MKILKTNDDVISEKAYIALQAHWNLFYKYIGTCTSYPDVKCIIDRSISLYVGMQYSFKNVIIGYKCIIV